ncbi:MAG TPA: hypothetical protein VK890_03205 [Bacteroidia bacterium]|jgi:tetratricopeptide (TPR) repeat protein|nr:hypothetical protein [Bacteroidia bacterium]
MDELTRVRLETNFQNADRLINQKAYEDSYKILQSIIREEPTFGKAYNHIAWYHRWRTKDYTAAEENYKKSIEFSPEYGSAYGNYAALLNLLRRWDDLPALVEKGLKVPGVDHGNLFNELGIMFEYQGKFKEAIEQYKRYALETLESETLEKIMQSIDRCKKKMELFK